ncbi:recombinase family protein [Streptomyces olivoreticuli]
MHAGDELVVTKLDRLGRSLENLIELSKRLEDDGVALVVLDQGNDTSTAIGRMFFQILGVIAEFEHALMSERTMDGLAAARARGRTGGQKPTWPSHSGPLRRFRSCTTTWFPAAPRPCTTRPSKSLRGCR